MWNSSGFCMPKILKSVHFRRFIQNIKRKTFLFWDTLYTTTRWLSNVKNACNNKPSIIKRRNYFRPMSVTSSCVTTWEVVAHFEFNCKHAPAAKWRHLAFSTLRSSLCLSFTILNIKNIRIDFLCLPSLRESAYTDMTVVMCHWRHVLQQCYMKAERCVDVRILWFRVNKWRRLIRARGNVPPLLQMAAWARGHREKWRGTFILVLATLATTPSLITANPSVSFWSCSDCYSVYTACSAGGRQCASTFRLVFTFFNWQVLHFSGGLRIR